MSIIDRVRAGQRPAPGRSADERVTVVHTEGLGVRALGVGALAAAASLGPVLVIVVLVWLLTPAGSVGFGSAVSVASASWLLAHGVAIHVPTGTPATVSVTLAPLGLTFLVAGAAWVVLRRGLRRIADTVSPPVWSRAATRQVLPWALAGYLAVEVLGFGLSLLGPAHAWLPGLLAGLLVPVLLLAGWAVREDQDEELVDVTRLLRAMPLWVRRGFMPGLLGLLALLAVGALVVIGALALRGSTVAALTVTLGAGFLGNLALALGQALLAPNLALMGLSVAAGPGFAIATGSTVSYGGSHPGLMPLVPVLGALPPDGPLPTVLRAGLLLPVAAGALIAWRASLGYAKLASVRAKGKAALTGCVIASLAVLLLGLLGAGSVGVDRLTAVGPNPWLLALAVLGETVVGALLWLGADALRARLGR